MPSHAVGLGYLAFAWAQLVGSGLAQATNSSLRSNPINLSSGRNWPRLQRGHFLALGGHGTFALWNVKEGGIALCNEKVSRPPRVPKCWSRPSFGGAFSLVPSRRRPETFFGNEERHDKLQLSA
jgi:hypothetical protein